MANQTLRGVTLQSLENYRNAATQVVVAYRLGGRRMVGMVNGALKNSVYPRTAKLAPRVTDRINDVRGDVSEIVVKGIDLVALRAEKAIKLGSNTAAAQVTKVAKFAAGVDNEIMASGLHTVARLTMPGAKVALAVSGKASQGANALADAIGARTVRKAVRKAHAGSKRTLASATRTTKATVKTAAKRGAKVAKARRAARAAK